MTTETTTTPTMLQVYTAPQEVKSPNIAIEWRRRSTKQNPVPAEKAYRCILVAEGALAVPTEQVSSKFHRLVQSTVHSIASDMLAAELKETDSREVQAARYTLDSVLAFWAEEKQRQQIDGKKIAAWLPTCETWKTLNEKQQKGWTTLLPKLAAPGYRNVLKPAEAAIVLSRLQDADTTTAVGSLLCERLAVIMSAAAVDNSEVL